MPRTYEEITEAQIDEVLRADKGWEKDVVRDELIYQFHLTTRPIIIKVYSSCRKDTGISRGCGADAIRVCAIWFNEQKCETRGLVKSMRINRTEGWEDRIRKRVTKVIEDAKVRFDRWYGRNNPIQQNSRPNWSNSDSARPFINTSAVPY